MDNYQLDIPICPTLFLMKCAKHIKGSNPTKGNGIPINNPLETPLKGIPETLPQA